MTKKEIVQLRAQARTCRVFAGESAAKAAYCAQDNDVEGFQRCMNEAARLALLAGKFQREAATAEKESQT